MTPLSVWLLELLRTPFPGLQCKADSGCEVH